MRRVRCDGLGAKTREMSDVVRYPDVAPLRDCHLGCCDLLERGVVHYGKHEATPCRGVTTGMLMLRVLSRNFRKVEALAPRPGPPQIGGSWGVVRPSMTRECDERMWNLAYRLAQSGEHQNYQAIEWELRAFGYTRAPQLLCHERVREKLDAMCAETRKRFVHHISYTRRSANDPLRGISATRR